MRLRHKFLLHSSGLVVLTMTAVMGIVMSSQTEVLREQERKRGLAIARNVAASSVNSLLANDWVDLVQESAAIAQGEDIIYLAVFDKDRVEKPVAFDSRFDIESEDTYVPDWQPTEESPWFCQEQNDSSVGQQIMTIAFPVSYIDEVDGQLSTEGTVLLGLSLEAIYEEIAALRHRLLLLWAVALSLGIFSSRFLARRITKPIEGVAKGALRYAKGDLSHRIEVQVTDEISVLADNLNHMAVQIHKNLNEIEDLNRGLEVKVEKRTKDLARANSDLVTAMDDLKDTQAKLIHSEKMASLGQLVAGVAHELNNPLNFIYNGLGPLRDSVTDLRELLVRFDGLASLTQTDRQDIDCFKEEIEYDEMVESLDELIATIGEGARRATVIVRDLRNFSRLDEAELKRANIHEGIEGSLNLMKHRLSGRIRLEKDFRVIPDFEFRPAQINQVFMNLLSNAEQSIKGKGTIQIRTRMVDHHAVVEFEDSGCGINPDDLHRIFEPFYTTKDVGEGTGLGLSITYGIIEQHGGVIDVRSQIGEGSCFSVKIPMKEKPEELPPRSGFHEAASC